MRLLKWTLLFLGCALISLAQDSTVKVKQPFHFDNHPYSYTFTTNDPQDFQRWETLKKINILSSEIILETSKGGHPIDKIKLLKKLTKELPL